ncbi:MAG: N-6 DNA methylase [Candidatus Methanomethylicaceae archaeon]
MDLEKELLNYVQKVKEVSSERAKTHLFLILMEKIFPGLNIGYIEGLFPEIEKYVSFKTKTIIARGKIDSLLGNVIIEFESDIKRMKRRAEEQLKRYVSILWNNELKELKKKINYIAVATDGIDFYVYRPDTAKEGEIREEDVELIPIEEFNMEKSKSEEILRWLDITFLSKKMRIPTTEEFKHVFGVGTAFYIAAFNDMKKAIEKFKKENRETFETLFSEWSKYLSIAYGSTIENIDFFIKHTYLSMLSKLMVYSFFSKGEILIEDKTILDILSGKIFEKWQIKNFFEEDFFSWIIRDPAKETGIKIAKSILEVLAKYDLTKLNEDILKGLYENLLDQKERHDLGEVYTPDWLVEYILRDLLKENPEASLLDPACGSGTFLFIAIRLKKEFLKNKMNKVDLLYHILENVKGIDIHPLAVLVAKTNYLLALGDDLLKTERHEVVLPIYMADSIRLIDENKDEYEGVKIYKIPTIDDETFFLLPCDFIEKKLLDPEEIDLLIDLIKDLSLEFISTGKLYKERIEDFLYEYIGISKDVKKYVDILTQNIRIFANKIISKNKDTIWCYILKNKHKPIDFTYRKFDLIVGNPPWVVFNAIKNVKYQEFLKKQIKTEYALTTSAELITHMEIATLFFVRCSELYLKDKGIIAFILPKSIFSGDQHSNFRNGLFKRVKFKFLQIIDLENVSPLFNVPSCVVFAKKNYKMEFPINVKIIEGTLERKNENYSKALTKLIIKESKVFLSKIGKRDFLSYEKIEFVGKSWYYEKFYQGASIVPGPFWQVDIITTELGFDYRKPYIKTNLYVSQNSKPPWKGIIFEGNVEREFLYKICSSSTLFPFSYFTTLAVLPVIISNSSFIIIKRDEAIKKYPLLSKWLEKAETTWNKLRGEKRQKLDIYERLNYASGITRQNPKKKFKVVYNRIGKDLVASVISSKTHDGKIIFDDGILYYENNDENESFYLASIFNSSTINKIIKPMQAKGLFGERGIQKKVLELPIPKFDAKNELHIRLATLGKLASKKAQKKLEEILEREYKNIVYLKPQYITRIRKEIREYIKDELKEIDEIVQRILKEFKTNSNQITLDHDHTSNRFG